jgi:hypothetical protein
MNSYISHFKSWILAIVAIIAIEASVYAAYHPSTFDRNNFLQFSFSQPETPQRLFMYHKLATFADSNPTIVQSGDSSGFYGIDPLAIMRYLPESVSYLNLSCCANLGFSGYYNVFRFMAERNDKLRYFVLHITPYTMPRPETWNNDGAALWGDSNIKVFGDAIYRDFVGPQQYIYPPSLAFRRTVTDRFFYLNGAFTSLDRPLLQNDNYFEFLKMYNQTRGWMPENDARNGVPPTECEINETEFFDLHRLDNKTYTEEVLDAYADLARRYQKTLVVVFQPVACVYGTGHGSAKTRAAIEHFKSEHPEVEVPFPLITTWPADLFSVPAHVVHEHIDLLAQRLGPMIADIVKRHGN